MGSLGWRIQEQYKGWTLSILDSGYAQALALLEKEIFDQCWDAQQFFRLLGTQYFLCCGALKDHELRAYVCGYILAGELEIVNLGVHNNFRRQGLGTQLLFFMLNQGQGTVIQRAVLEVGAHNFAAQAMYVRCGFQTMSVRKGYYQDRHEDALVMEWTRNQDPKDAYS